MKLKTLSCAVALTIAGSWAQAADFSTHPMQRFSDASEIEGSSSTLLRHKKGVTMTVQTSELTPGDAYTNWFIVFNIPGDCDTQIDDGAGDDPDGCGEAEVFGQRGPFGDNTLQIDIIFGTGHVVGSETGNFASTLREGDTSGSALANHFGLEPVGLIDASIAEIHGIVRTHGPAVPGSIPTQIHTLEPGCPTCVDEQFVVHK
jgi:hypothetical protein